MTAFYALAFIIFFVFFEGMIFNEFAGAFGRCLLPALLIGGGVALLFRRNVPYDKRKIEQ